DITTKHIRVSIPLKNLSATVFQDQSWIIDKFPRDVTAEASHTALYDFLVAPMDEKKKVILGQVSPTVAAVYDRRECLDSGLPAVIDRRYSWGKEGAPGERLSTLNPSQQEAVHRAA